LTSVSIYQSPYSEKVLSMSTFESKIGLQLVMLYEQGVLPIYLLKEGRMEQMFKIEFKQMITTDFLFYDYVNDFQVQLLVSLSNYNRETSLCLVNYNWERSVSIYYQIVSTIALPHSEYPIEKIVKLSNRKLLLISRRQFDLVIFERRERNSDFEPDFGSYKLSTSTIEGGVHDDPILTSIKLYLPQFLHASIDDNYLHPFVVLNSGIDRRLTLVKVNDKSKIRTCKIKIFKQTSHAYSVS
jgi:hypothetical protein